MFPVPLASPPCSRVICRECVDDIPAILYMEANPVQERAD